MQRQPVYIQIFHEHDPHSIATFQVYRFNYLEIHIPLFEPIVPNGTQTNRELEIVDPHCVYCVSCTLRIGNFVIVTVIRPLGGIRTDITDITFVFIFLSGFEFKYG